MEKVDLMMFIRCVVLFAVALPLAKASEYWAERLLLIRQVDSTGSIEARRDGRVAKLSARVVFAAVLMTGAGMVQIVSGDSASDELLRVVWALFGSSIAYVIALCDVRARIIPWECCAALAGAGLVAGVLFEGAAASAWTVTIAVATWLAVKLAAAIAHHGGVEAIGAGDVRCVPACILFLGAGQAARASPLLAGLLVSSVLCCALVVGAVLAGRLALDDHIPFGPFFSGWVYSGMVAVPAAATWM